MMPIFNDVTLPWGGGEQIVPHAKVLGAIAIAESIVTLGELAAMADRMGLRYSQLSSAYGALLRYAGAKVTDEEVYDSFFGDASGKMVGRALEIVYKLHELMIPPEHMRAAEKKLTEVRAAEAEAGKVAAGEGTGSLPRPTDSSSATAT